VTAPKTLVSWGYSAKLESTYGTINANGVADGILLTKIPTLDVPKWLNVGDRGVTPAGGQRQEVAQSGRWGGFKLEAEGIGAKAAAAYAAGVKPHLDVLNQISGMASTGSFTAAQEFYQYTPQYQPTALVSATTEAVVASQLYRLYGAYADLSIAANGPMVPLFTYDVNGVLDLITDTTIPVYTSYPLMTDLPQKADSIGLKIGLFTAGIVKSFAFKQGRNIKGARTAISGGLIPGHAGFTPAYATPTLEVVIERCATLTATTPWNAATTLNPYRLAEDKVPVILSLDVGSVQYKRWHLYSGTGVTTGTPNPTAQAVLKDVKDTAEGATATWTLTFEFFNSTYNASDAYSLMWN
jgi:hypothetical protein